MALACNAKHSTDFFDECCHPLLVSFSLFNSRLQYLKKKRVQANESLNGRPAQCIPKSVTTSTDSNDDDDDDLPFCDDDDDGNTTPPSTTPTPAVPKPTPTPTPTAARQATPAPAPPSGNSAVQTGGLYVCLGLSYSLHGTYIILKCDLLLSKWRRRSLRHRSQGHRLDCCHRCVHIS